MDFLKRDSAPLPAEAWTLIDAEARRVLALYLAGRKVVDFHGPNGMAFAAVNTGRVRRIDDPAPGVGAGVRIVEPLVELRAPFVLDRAEFDAVARGADNPDLAAITTCAEAVARIEDGAIFHGYAAAGIRGMLPSTPHAPIAVESAADWPRAVVRAKEVLRAAGVGGPYALAMGPAAYDEVSAGTQEGYPLRKRIEEVMGGPVVWAPAMVGAVLLSTRGGDFELTIGQDWAIGYQFHERQTVELFLTESFSFRVLEPAAAVAIR